jgi:hypothetical protein
MESKYIQNDVFEINNFFSKILILQLVFQSFFAATNLDLIQIFSEILLILTFVFHFILFNVRFNKFELWLLSILIFTTLISCIINPLEIAILNAKVYILAIFSLIFFSKFFIKPFYITLILCINYFFILYQIVFGNLPFSSILNPIVGAFGEYIDSRPLGLFLNTHFSAYLIAIFLIYYGHKKKLFGSGIAILYFTFSKFTIVSYVIHIITKSKIIFYFKRYFRKITLILIILSFIIITKYSNEIMNFNLGAAYTSFNSIAEQLLTIDSYTLSFSIFPDDTNKIMESFTNKVGNEVMYFTLIFQGGIILFLLYMIYFTSKLKHFKLFVLISMLHYGFSMSPLVIFLIITYNRKIDKILLTNEKK